MVKITMKWADTDKRLARRKFSITERDCKDDEESDTCEQFRWALTEIIEAFNHPRVFALLAEVACSIDENRDGEADEVDKPFLAEALKLKAHWEAHDERLFGKGPSALDSNAPTGDAP